MWFVWVAGKTDWFHCYQALSEHFRDEVHDEALYKTTFFTFFLTLSLQIQIRLYTLSYWCNPPFLISDIQALWRSVLSARAPECQKLKMVGYTSMALNPLNSSNLDQLALNGLTKCFNCVCSLDCVCSYRAAGGACDGVLFISDGRTVPLFRNYKVSVFVSSAGWAIHSSWSNVVCLSVCQQGWHKS